MRTSPLQEAPCRIPGLPPSARSAGRKETTFHPRFSKEISRTNLVPNRCAQWCSDGRNEASNCARAGGLGGANARADANEVDTGHCRRDHSGRSPRARPGYKPPFSSSHRRGLRQREPGADDFGSSGPTVRCSQGSCADGMAGEWTSSGSQSGSATDNARIPSHPLLEPFSPLHHQLTA